MSERINSIFSKIHKNYDAMNRIMSFGIDVRWRKIAAKKMIEDIGQNSKILDIATGTGDLALAIYDTAEKSNKKIELYAMDINKEMIEIAKKKFGNRKISVIHGDALKMPYSDNFFDAISVGFGARNFDDLKIFSDELMRVLKDGGFFVIMDMALPKKKYQRMLFKFYFQIIRFWGHFIDRESYEWLISSIEHFDFEKFKVILEKSGFENVRYDPLSFGITYVISGKKGKRVLDKTKEL
ncbi:ubiquinone/menaquinone biosynthesis methyltransferase [Athalassotoga saccharophila]|uniref:ubiquinone/menaquinone biosynthesis methyltransferase n=1 Tax=Athalassotoga saccharophila TaxID=1441386 RepID=UPI0013798C66|nr:ubiquinone/menaquinone biosynthesis methyltransferase [Athalassotoga saccharophila]BBJ28476.1 demethylmenaquinone methyltransferase [Athalassotoga saccharophila]